MNDTLVIWGGEFGRMPISQIIRMMMLLCFGSLWWITEHGKPLV